MTGADWESRINFDRMRKERLARAREAMSKFDLGAMVVYHGANVRYITGVYQGMWKYSIFIRYAVLCRDSEPILFETAGSDMEAAKLNCPWMYNKVKNMVSGVVDVLRENKVANEKIGIDLMDMWVHEAFKEAGVNLVNAWPALSTARLIKTVDELECCKYSAAIGDACMDMIRNEWLAKPGLTESQLAGLVMKYFTDHGFEEGQAFCIASGGNTNPYQRWWSDKPIRKGDLVITDIGGRGPGGGYYVDLTRTHICGEAAPTPEQKQLYKETMESLNGAISEAWPGKTTADAAKHFPEYDDDIYKTCTLFQFGHSIGLTLYEGMWISRGFSFDFPAEFKQNMYMALETYSGKPGLGQAVRLENDVVITDKGPVLFTLYPFEERFLE
jgi:Xaa-Pro aminopeptidase